MEDRYKQKNASLTQVIFGCLVLGFICKVALFFIVAGLYDFKTSSELFFGKLSLLFVVSLGGLWYPFLRRNLKK